MRWLSAFEECGRFRGAGIAAVDPPLWLMGHVAWFQEHWIARNVQRQRGIDCDPTAARLASIVPDADRWYDGRQATRDERWQLDAARPAGTRQYLADTMDLTLELLDGADEDDAALYFFRLALFHEDLQGETCAEIAQTLGLEARRRTRPAAPTSRRVRRASRCCFRPRAGCSASPPGGFVFDNEKWAHEVEVPEFDIDAQAVTWAQYGEFVEDGGYDDRAWWSPTGREWLQREERRVPRYVDQMRQGVLQQRFGRLRAGAARAAGDARELARGRRLVPLGRAAPAHRGRMGSGGAVRIRAASRGARCGNGRRRRSGPIRAFAPDPWVEYSQPAFGTHKVLRGASFATSPALAASEVQAVRAGGAGRVVLRVPQLRRVSPDCIRATSHWWPGCNPGPRP